MPSSIAQPNLGCVSERHELPADDQDYAACGATLTEMKGQTDIVR